MASSIKAALQIVRANPLSLILPLLAILVNGPQVNLSQPYCNGKTLKAKLLSDYMPWKFWELSTDQELQAIYLYLA